MLPVWPFREKSARKPRLNFSTRLRSSWQKKMPITKLPGMEFFTARSLPPGDVK